MSICRVAPSSECICRLLLCLEASVQSSISYQVSPQSTTVNNREYRLCGATRGSSFHLHFLHYSAACHAFHEVSIVHNRFFVLVHFDLKQIFHFLEKLINRKNLNLCQSKSQDCYQINWAFRKILGNCFSNRIVFWYDHLEGDKREGSFRAVYKSVFSKFFNAKGAYFWLINDIISIGTV